ncbi:hypothetical protein BCY76_002615 [Nesterenkonia sp. PF2B19]|nr:hypothetical protein BCY76_002615 [Nesterenkonia sp. PF2B19]
MFPRDVRIRHGDVDRASPDGVPAPQQGHQPPSVGPFVETQLQRGCGSAGLCSEGPMSRARGRRVARMEHHDHSRMDLAGPSRQRRQRDAVDDTGHRSVAATHPGGQCFGELRTGGLRGAVDTQADVMYAVSGGLIAQLAPSRL